MLALRCLCIYVCGACRHNKSQAIIIINLPVLVLCRCLDAILHAEHKGMLEEMRTSYMLTQRHQVEDDYQTGSSDVQAIVNGKTSSGLFGITQEDGTLFLTRSLGLRTLLGLTSEPGSKTR